MLKSILPDEGRNKADRKRLVDRAFAAIKGAITLPEECRNSIYDEFDPVLITLELIEGSMYKMFDDILDYNGDDAGFIKMFKDNNAKLIVEIISEIEEGFIEGLNDVLVFIRLNIINLIMASAPASQAATAKGIAVPVMMKFIDKCWSERPNKPAEAAPAKEQPKAPTPAPQAAPVATPAAASQQPEELKDGEFQPIKAFLASAKSAQERKQMLLSRYREQVQKDQAALQEAGRTAARPLSRAFQSLDLTANNTLVDEEEKLNLQAYQKESSQKALTRDEFFKSKMRLSLLDTGMYSSAIVDEEMKKIDAVTGIPEPLKQAYFQMVQAGIKSRLANDNDYKQIT